MKLNEKQIKENWSDLMGRIDHQFEGERKEKLLEMYKHFEERMMFAPASSREHFHNCFIGGYVDHVLRVMDCAFEVYNSWTSAGGYMENYSLEELLFSALNHDLGKIGDMDNDAYIPNPSEWHRKNQGQLYKANPETPFALVPDRSLFLLNQFGIKYSYNEFLGIKLHDGMYDDSNKPYLMSFNPDARMACNLPYVLHQADMMASRIEYERWKFGENGLQNVRTLKGASMDKIKEHIPSQSDIYNPPVPKEGKPAKKTVKESAFNSGSDAAKLFDELFS